MNIINNKLLYAFLGFLAGLILGFLVWGLPGSAEATRSHREWGEWQQGEWGACRAEIPECNEEGYAVGLRWRTDTRECTRVRGRGNDECRPRDTQERSVSERCRVRVPICEPEPTTRLCHWEEEGYEAIAVTEGERARHERFHKLDKDWEQGMDANCEFPPEPEPEPEEPRGTTEAGPPPLAVCTEVVNAPTITEVGRIDDDSVYARWTEVADHVNDYLVWYGLSEDNLLWNTRVEGEYVELNEVPNQHIWLKVAGVHENCVGPFSLTIDP